MVNEDTDGDGEPRLMVNHNAPGAGRGADGDGRQADLSGKLRRGAAWSGTKLSVQITQRCPRSRRSVDGSDRRPKSGRRASATVASSPRSEALVRPENAAPRPIKVICGR